VERWSAQTENGGTLLRSTVPPFIRSTALGSNPRHLSEDLSLCLVRPATLLLRRRTSRTRSWRCVDYLGPSRRTRRLHDDRTRCRRGRRRSRWCARSDSLLRRTTCRLCGAIRGFRCRRQAGFRRRNLELCGRRSANGSEVALQPIVHRLIAARASRYANRGSCSDQESWSKRPHDYSSKGDCFR
jgi:hypothetical protein